MSKAEGFYKKWYLENQGIEIMGDLLSTDMDAVRFAEAYHEERVNAELKLYKGNQSTQSMRYQISTEAKIEVLEKLLKL